MRMKQADVSSLRVLCRARDQIDRDYAEPIAPVPDQDSAKEFYTTKAGASRSPTTSRWRAGCAG
jgi:hypothetical protein